LAIECGKGTGGAAFSKYGGQNHGEGKKGRGATGGRPLRSMSREADGVVWAGGVSKGLLEKRASSRMSGVSTEEGEGVG